MGQRIASWAIRVVYRPADLEEWLQSRTARDTSDADARFLKAFTVAHLALRMGLATRILGLRKSTAAIRSTSSLACSGSTRTQYARGSARAGGHRWPAPDGGPRRGNPALPRRAPGAGQAGIRSRPHLLPAVPYAKGARGRGRRRIQTGDTCGTLQGICPDCNRMIYRRVNPKKLDAVRGDLDIIVTQARPRIEETVRHNVNCDSTGGSDR